MKSTPNAAERFSFLSTKLSKQPHSSAIMEWSELMVEQGKAKEAAQKLASAQAKYAASYRFHIVLGRAYRAAGNVQKAKEVLEIACALAPQNEVALRELILLEAPAVKSAPRSTEKNAVTSATLSPETSTIEDAIASNLDALKYKKPEPPPLPMQIDIDPISADDFFREMNTDIIDDINELMPKTIITESVVSQEESPSPAINGALPDIESMETMDLPKELESPQPYPAIEESVDESRIAENDDTGFEETLNVEMSSRKREDVPVFDEVKVLEPEGAVQIDKEKLSKVLSKLSIASPVAKSTPDPAPAFTGAPPQETSIEYQPAFADSQIEDLAAALSNMKMTPIEETSDPTPIMEQRQPVSDDEDIKFPTRNLAEIFVAQGAFAKAIKVYEQLAEKEPHNAMLFGIIVSGLRTQLKL